MSELYELGKGLRGMGDFLRGLSGEGGPGGGDDGQQSGTALVGSAENAYSKACVVSFPKEFASVPVVVANAFRDEAVQNTDLPDTFAVTITKVDKQGFRANVYRVDPLFAWSQEGPKPPLGWTQALRLSWAAFVPGASRE